MYPLLFSLNNQVDVPSTWIEPRMYPPLCSLLQPRSYTLLTQNSQMVSSLNSVFGQRILRWLVLWILWLGNQKISQMFSSLNSFGKREKERRREKQKDSTIFVFAEFSFLQGKIEQKLRMNLEKVLQEKSSGKFCVIRCVFRCYCIFKMRAKVLYL